MLDGSPHYAPQSRGHAQGVHLTRRHVRDADGDRTPVHDGRELFSALGRQALAVVESFDQRLGAKHDGRCCQRSCERPAPNLVDPCDELVAVVTELLLERVEALGPPQFAARSLRMRTSGREGGLDTGAGVVVKTPKERSQRAALGGWSSSVMRSPFGSESRRARLRTRGPRSDVTPDPSRGGGGIAREPKSPFP